MTDDVKAEITQMLNGIEDENLLYIIKEDIQYYTQEKDIVDGLTSQQLAELDEAIDEANGSNNISWNDFKDDMNKWKTR